MMDEKKRKEYYRERYMRNKGNTIQQEREVIKKEIVDSKNYIKKIWGEETPLKELNYKELRKLGEELGMNIFNVKNFNDRYIKGQKRFKKYTRVCKYCKKYYDIEIERKVRPKGSGVCPACKEKNYKEGGEKRKIKNKIKWERLILDVLEKNGRLTILEIGNKLECSGYPIRWTVKELVDDGKVRLFKVGKVGFVSLK